jgi:phosphatidylserine/phosphatidylglycerophosphate/cardiolipin synthase-like enzyme
MLDMLIMADRQNILYSGDSSYKYVEKLIKGQGKELMIISPYLSGYYTKMLASASQRKNVRVITSGSSAGYRDSIIDNYVVRSIRGYIKAIIFLAVLEVISIFLNFIYTDIILALMIAIIALAAYVRYNATSKNMKIKVIRDRFVHEKLYIGDDMAISGSANLTYNGMHKNIEHIEVTTEQYKISELRSHFESMWRNN